MHVARALVTTAGLLLGCGAPEGSADAGLDARVDDAARNLDAAGPLDGGADAMSDASLAAAWRREADLPS